MPKVIEAATKLSAEALRYREQLDQARRRVGSSRSTVQALEDALKINPDNARLLTNLGFNYFNIQEYQLASATFERALSVEPSLDRAGIGLGQSYMELGDFAGAATAFEALFLRGNRTFPVCRNLGLLPGSKVDAELLPALEELQATNVSDRKGFEAAHAFIRANIFHKAGQYPEAWQETVSANRHKYLLLQQERDAQAQSNAVDLERVRQSRGTPVVGHEVTDVPRSLFILGPSRCGKSSLERLIGGLDYVKRGFENGIINDVQRIFRAAGLLQGHRISALAPDTYETFRCLYVEELAERVGDATVLTNTMPELVIDADLIAEIVPNARLIFVRRDIDDIAIRIYMKDYETDSNPYAYDVEAIYEYVRWYDEMSEALVDRLPRISRVVSYEDMIADPQSVLEVAAELCGHPTGDVQLPPIGDDRGCAEPYKDFMRAALKER